MYIICFALAIALVSGAKKVIWWQTGNLLDSRKDKDYILKIKMCRKWTMRHCICYVLLLTSFLCIIYHLETRLLFIYRNCYLITLSNLKLSNWIFGWLRSEWSRPNWRIFLKSEINRQMKVKLKSNLWRVGRFCKRSWYFYFHIFVYLALRRKKNI